MTFGNFHQKWKVNWLGDKISGMKLWDANIYSLNELLKIAVNF
jgi:hypothetical protein